MLIEPWYKMPIIASLVTIFGIITLSIVASILHHDKVELSKGK